MKMKLSRKSKALKASERENAALQGALALATIVPENPDEEQTVLVNDETDADESLTGQVLLDELAQIARVPGYQRSYAEALKRAGFALHTF
jgi:hypothetical protein